MAGNRLLTALVSDLEGNIFELEGYAAVGMAGTSLKPLSARDAIPLPHGSELLRLPGRQPILYDLHSRRFETVTQNPYKPGEPILPVAAFCSPGYAIRSTCAYRESQGATQLPLFAYGAAGWLKNGFQVSALMVDPEPRQDLRHMLPRKIRAGIQKMRNTLPDNRLRKHLERCALVYGCPAGKNFFLGRYEAPLPTARRCNARCLGCISFQDGDVKSSQERIGFTPTPEEIAQVALAHIQAVSTPIVSFGQGCEGDPLLAAHVIEPAVRIIRKETAKGTINMNTNAGRPDTLTRLWNAGLDSMRVSMNSVRRACYQAYFRPKGYGFDDVLRSIDMALDRGKLVTINYFNCPGFTDAQEEASALIKFIDDHPIHMIQWRNLNFDPIRYMRVMNSVAGSSNPMGLPQLLKRLKRRFPKLVQGYFNPPREKFALLNYSTSAGQEST